MTLERDGLCFAIDAFITKRKQKYTRKTTRTNQRRNENNDIFYWLLIKDTMNDYSSTKRRMTACTSSVVLGLYIEGFIYSVASLNPRAKKIGLVGDQCELAMR
jgi:hypothetical protein